MNADQAYITSMPTERPTPRQGVTLRTKGMWLLITVFMFTVTSGLVIYREREQLLSTVQQLQAVHISEESKLGLYLSVARAVMVVNEQIRANDSDSARGLITSEIESVMSGLQNLRADHPIIDEDFLALQKNMTELKAAPNIGTFGSVRRNLHKIFLDVNDISTSNASQEAFWLNQYFKTSDRLSLEWTFFAIVGIVGLGSLVMLFVTRLGLDIRRVQDRAMQIVEGYRGEPLEVTRNDELGSLMEGINKMQQELRRREIQVELSRQQQFHKEKMAAVGSLAAVVAHEINNPLSSIVGLSQAMVDLGHSHQCQGCKGTCQPELILSQAKRIMAITHQISEFSTPQSSEPKLCDLNELIRSTAKFVSFDRRFRAIDLSLSLNPQLPAIYVVGDHMTQVLMNLLINAADASDGRSEVKPKIALSSGSDEDWCVITVTDNGPGMEPAVLAHVFEEYFTTKPPGKGTGIGLSVSKSLIESSGGSISIESEPGKGTTVTIRLPIKSVEINGSKEE